MERKRVDSRTGHAPASYYSTYLGRQPTYCTCAVPYLHTLPSVQYVGSSEVSSKLCCRQVGGPSHPSSSTLAIADLVCMTGLISPDNEQRFIHGHISSFSLPTSFTS